MSPGDSPGVATKSSRKSKYEVATFGGGCFWHVEAVFDRMKGVKEAVSGYAGGNVAFPSYEMVHTGLTGHIEVVQVIYDPKVVTYEELLKAFWACHDPTSVDRQGPDEGTQYRSAIFYSNQEQKKAALKSYKQLMEARAYAAPIVTQLLPLRAFYRAEEYHQDYYGGKPRPYSPSRHRSSTGRARSASRRSTSSSKGAAQGQKPSQAPAAPSQP